MKIVLLDGEKIKSMKQVHAAFASALAFPEWYGANLDALHDMLTDGVEPVGVIIANPELLKSALGRRWSSFMRLMRALQNEREEFYFTLDPFDID